MLDNILGKIRRMIPSKIFAFFQPAYHLSLSFLSALWYRFPSKKITVIAITGTKGKSSTTEILNAILEEAGYKTALSNTIRCKVDNSSYRNLHKMSMPGRFFLQGLLRRAVNEKCDYFILETTSQGALLYRHHFIEFDTFVFTNLRPEHIEAHGSYEKYAKAKVSICESLKNSRKKNKTIVVNSDDPESERFLKCEAHNKVLYSLKNAEPYNIKASGLEFTLQGKHISSDLSGVFNLYNILAASTTAIAHNVEIGVIAKAIQKFSIIPGRVEKIHAELNGGRTPVTIIVDYAHTPDSLEKLYKIFEGSKNICILGGTGGGRDTWKRKEMGRIADKYCAEIILTDEDPYDEDPKKIVDDVAEGIVSKKPTIIMDRKEAIREACKRANTGDNIIITGKGTDPYIMGPNGSKVPWSDAEVVREIIKEFER